MSHELGRCEDCRLILQPSGEAFDQLRHCPRSYRPPTGFRLSFEQDALVECQAKTIARLRGEVDDLRGALDDIARNGLKP